MAGQSPASLSWLYVVISIASLNFSPFVTAAFVTPLTYTAYLDQADVRFHCTTVNARDISWCVDDETEPSLLLARGITTEVNPMALARNESNLTISATTENNDAHIQCLAFYGTGNNYTSVSSNESTFYVQGELANLTDI